MIDKKWKIALGISALLNVILGGALFFGMSSIENDVIIPPSQVVPESQAVKSLGLRIEDKTLYKPLEDSEKEGILNCGAHGPDNFKPGKDFSFFMELAEKGEMKRQDLFSAPGATLPVYITPNSKKISTEELKKLEMCSEIGGIVPLKANSDSILWGRHWDCGERFNEPNRTIDPDDELSLQACAKVASDLKVYLAQ